LVIRPTEAPASTSIDASHLFPWRQPAGVRLPADSCSAGARPAQDARWAAEGETGHVGPRLGHDHLRHLLPDAGDRLQQLDLVRPGLAGLSYRAVEVGQGGLHHVEAAEEAASQSRVIGAEVADEGFGELGNLGAHLSLAMSASTAGSSSPAIMALSINRAETVVRDDATTDSLIEASSSISSSLVASRVRSCWS
jgi:hypothetical protein